MIGNVATDLRVEHDGVVLAGSLWRPGGAPRTVVVMHPGSGPSDRHNDVYFPPIRELLLDAGHAVASFDKRGAGGSSGSLATTSIGQQAGDLLACADAVREHVPGVPVGAFGHSQGGWVAFEAAARREGLAFAIANAGPGVSTADQERYSVANTAPALVEVFERLLELARAGGDVVAAGRVIDDAGEVAAPVAGLLGDADADAWQLWCLLLCHDPAEALAAIDVPLLVLYGADDRMVPVGASVDRLRRFVRADLLHVAVLSGGDHRMQRNGHLVDGYAVALLGFLDGL